MEWWVDDLELLGATLGMLAAWEDDKTSGKANSSARENGSASSSHSDSGDSATPPAATALVSTRTGGHSVNISRERRKQEAEQLRRKVVEMQRKLDGLQRRRQALLRPHYRDPQTQSQLVTTAPIWESMATRQFQARRKSESVNSKLKMTLAAQARVTEDLLRLLQRAQHSGAERLPLPIAFDVSVRVTQEQQLARITVMRLQWEAVLKQAPKLQDGPLQFCDLTIVENDGTATMSQLCTSNVLPFSISRVEAALWSLFEDDTPVDDAISTFEQSHQSTVDTVFSTYKSTATIGGSARGSITGRWATKRFGGDGSQRFLVSHSFAEPCGFRTELDQALITEEVWVRLIDAHDLGHVHLPQPLTVIQHIQHNRIAFSMLADRSDLRRAETLTRQYMHQGQEELLWAQQMIENALMASGPTMLCG